MDSHTGVKKLAGTNLQVSNLIRLGRNLNAGTAGQVIVSNGPNQPVQWDTNSAPLSNALTMGTNVSLTSGNSSFDGSVADTINATDSDTQLNLTAALPIVINDLGGLNKQVDIDIDTATMGISGGELEVLKVPNSLTFTGTSTGTFDGSSALSINLTDTDTTYQGSSTININTATTPDTINCLKVPNVMTASTNIIFTNTDDGASATNYDGSQPITIRAIDTDTTYQGGTNINIDTSTTPDSINLDTSITGQTGITFLNSGAATNLTGSNYPNKPTTATYLDLSSNTNTIPGGVLATKVQRTASFRSFTTAYGEYSSNFRTSFVATSTNVMVEFRGIIRADNKVFYGGLYDYNSGVYQADTRNRFNYNDESDQDMTTMTWWMRNLTKGTTYYISPYFRGSSSTVYIYAGHTGATDGFAPAIMRIYDGGNNVGIY